MKRGDLTEASFCRSQTKEGVYSHIYIDMDLILTQLRELVAEALIRLPIFNKMKLKNIAKTLTVAPLLLSATSAFALYCGTDSNQNHINAGRAELMYGINVNAIGSGEYLGMSSGSTMLQETSSGYFQKTTSCPTGGGDEEPPTSGGTVVHEDLGPVAAQNPENTLKKVAEFTGKNYHVAVSGSDLVEDIGGDQQADRLLLPRTVYVDIPANAVVEAAYVNYYGSAYLTDHMYAEDNTDDTVSGSELGFDTEDDIANNEINITIGTNDLGPLTPSSAAVGAQSESIPSWWKMFGSAGTMEDSKVTMWNNRLDLTSQFTGLTGSIPVTVTRLQRADFSGTTASAMEMGYAPAGRNDNGDLANDCLANASYSVIVVYYLPEGEDKTISIYDGIAWGWNNDFATSGMKAHQTIPYKAVTDIQILHDAIDATGDTKLYLGALDGDEYGHSGVPQCGSSQYPHDTGKDYTWIKNGTGSVQYYENIYEGSHAPDVGTSFASYPEVKTVANGINFNVVAIDIENDVDNAVNTLIHVEGDNPVSTQVDQEAMLISFAILEAKTMEQGTEPPAPTNTAPVVTMNGDAEMTLTVGDTFTDPGATATDAEDGAITPVADCNVSTSVAGTYTCTYTATDSGDLTDTATRTVIVEEEEPPAPTNTAPVVTLNGDASVTLEFGAAWTDPGASATDAEDGAITPVVDCPVDTQVAGTYTCTYTATDSGALSDSVTRTVVVEEEVVEPPQQSCTEFTATYQQHVDAGRAEILYLSNIYVIGSGEYLGSTYIGGTATLIETGPGAYAVGTCP